jgi:hypothetical protein
MGRDHLGDLYNIKIDFKEIGCVFGLDTLSSAQGSCERGNESSSSTKGGDFLYQPRGYQLPKDSEP